MFKKLKKWAGEHRVELMVSSLFLLGCAGTGCLFYALGYTNGSYETDREVRDFIAKLRENGLGRLIDRCGAEGFFATMDAIGNANPELFKLLDEDMRTKDYRVEDYYYNSPDIKEWLDVLYELEAARNKEA